MLVFTIFWIGGILVTFNGQLLGAKMYLLFNIFSSIFQTLCLLGYCMFPLNITTLCFQFVLQGNNIMKFLIIALAGMWSVYCNIFLISGATGFIKQLVQEDKKLLVLYPVILFYLFLSGFALMNQE